VSMKLVTSNGFFCWLLLCYVAIANAEAYSAPKDVEDTQKSRTHEELTAASKEIDRLEAEIAKQQEKHLSGPKRRFIGARTKDPDMAFYMEQWRQKVEKYGNEHYPEAARNRLYGKVRLTTLIRSDGTVEEVQINQSSGHGALDRHALNIVRGAAPYAPFNKRLKKKADILGLTRTFTYTKE